MLKHFEANEPLDKDALKARIKELRDASDEMSNARAVIDSNSLSEADRELFFRLSDTFKNGLPDNDELLTLTEKAKRNEELKLKNEKLSLNDDEEARFMEYERFFLNEGKPSETARKLATEWGEKPDHEHKAENLREQAERIDSDVSITKKKSVFTIAFLITLALVSLLVTVLSILPKLPNFS